MAKNAQGAQVRTCICARRQTHIHAYIYIYICVCVCVCNTCNDYSIFPARTPGGMVALVFQTGPNR